MRARRARERLLRRLHRAGDWEAGGRGVSESLLPMTEVRKRVGLCPSMVYRLVSQGRFPKPGKFGTKSLWVESEVSAWIAERIRLRNMGRNMGERLAA